MFHRNSRYIRPQCNLCNYYDRHKSTLWKLNISVLNKKIVVKEIKKEVDECINDNIAGQVDPTIIWDTVKAIMKEKIISRTA